MIIIPYSYLLYCPFKGKNSVYKTLVMSSCFSLSVLAQEFLLNLFDILNYFSSNFKGWAHQLCLKIVVSEAWGLTEHAGDFSYNKLV